MKKFLLLLLLPLLTTAQTKAQEIPNILPLRDRAAVEDALLQERLEKLLPGLMRREGIDMWVIVAREYNEDPVAKTMLPATWLAARRRTIMLFHDKGTGKGVEKLAVARYDIGNLMKGAWAPEQEPNQWKRLVQLIAERNPKKIGLNYSPTYAHADGLTKAEYDSLIHYLPAAHKKAVVSAERLAVDWLQTRTERELDIYEQISRMGHKIIAEGFSEKVIQPGVTTTEDVMWWYRERIADLKLDAWFHPTVDVQRANPGAGDSQRSFSQRPGVEVIMPGDLLHVDLGITYLGLNTDVQQLAYVLKPGEAEAPAYLRKALATGNRLQDILTSKFKEGKTGNQVLKEALAQAQKEKIIASIYSHPIGYHGHGAGPAIGMWDMQQGVPGTGDYPLRHNTAYAIELNAKVNLPEWNNKEIRVMLEEQAVLTPNGVRYIDGRQKELLLIPRVATHLKQ
ncbi:M24 family metallopeptidase [Pontibacter cellulosilyticus]|uniref:M24 family metallopeptidase n=1 Tax=Pontibacter cellulosilyticus TaxID=1720253 RepID=A0A923N6D4_9BACT|nr:M24 family metallopeptidase [Pontibacter cellulosilyticus]MBC5992281.1 M24 family metallopeptidase [Pontibacter cellulosilyticus]